MYSLTISKVNHTQAFYFTYTIGLAKGKFMKDNFTVSLLSMACIISLIISAVATDIPPIPKKNTSATTNFTIDQLEQRSETSPEFEGGPAISEAGYVENTEISEASGNISDTKKNRTLGELKYLFDKCVDYDNPLVRHTALVIASKSPGEYFHRTNLPDL